MHNPNDVRMEVSCSDTYFKLTPNNGILFQKTRRMTLLVYRDANSA